MIRSIALLGLLSATVPARVAMAGGSVIDLDCTSLLGGTSVAVRPGADFRAVVSMRSDLPIEVNSALFRVVLTRPGIVIEDYDWHPPWETGGFTDFSLQGVALPSPIDATTLQGPAYPANVADVEFGNFLMTGTAGVGTLVTMFLRVPEGTAPGDQFFVVAVPDTFALGFIEFSAQPAAVLTVNVVQTPDFNFDAVVDGADLGHLLAAWGTPAGDLNGDGTTDGGDLGTLLYDWGPLP